MEIFGGGFVWIGATFCFIEATLRVIEETSSMIGATNQLSPNSDGITGLKKWLRFDFGAISPNLTPPAHFFKQKSSLSQNAGG